MTKVKLEFQSLFFSLRRSIATLYYTQIQVLKLKLEICKLLRLFLGEVKISISNTSNGKNRLLSWMYHSPKKSSTITVIMEIRGTSCGTLLKSTSNHFEFMAASRLWFMETEFIFTKNQILSKRLKQVKFFRSNSNFNPNSFVKEYCGYLFIFQLP